MTKLNGNGELKFAAQYSRASADLVAKGQVDFDYFKCPPWPDVIAAARELRPAYVHFSLRVGRGTGDAFDSETGQAPDWKRTEALLAQTGTAFVNLHLVPALGDHPGIPLDTSAPEHVDFLTQCLVRDTQAVVARFGRERVVAENCFSGEGECLRPGFMPDVIRRVIEETGCGMLLDLSHARLAALELGMSAEEYIRALPVERTREIHITGMQRFDEYWTRLAQHAGVDADTLAWLSGRQVDHLPMTGEDWKFAEWSMTQIRNGAWGRPWVLAFEYGGIRGPLWEAVTQAPVLLEQIPRLYDMVLLQRDGDL